MRSVTLLDGGMGQELIRRSKQPPTPMWSAQMMLDMPDLVEQLHGEFIDAGAQIITVNTYSATPERLDRYGQGKMFDSLHEAACNVARRARDSRQADHVQIAGCLPPLVASYHPELAPDPTTSRANYQRVVAAQVDKVDLFLCETMGSVSEAVIASTAALATNKPVWVALSLEDNKPDTLRSGESWLEAVKALQGTGIAGLLLNCSRPETINSQWDNFHVACDVPTGAYANGFTSVDALDVGGTVNVLEARQDLGPEAYAKFALSWADKGAAMVGGCCEVGPDHIRYLHEELGKTPY